MPETKNNGRVAILFGSKKCAALIKIWPELIPVNFITCQDSESGLSPLLSPPSYPPMHSSRNHFISMEE